MKKFTFTFPSERRQKKVQKTFYLTTTLPYVNAEPHLGFAFEIVYADVLARYRVLMGDDVFFNTGTDEHGQKIYQKALETNTDPQAYANEYAEKFKHLKERLNLYPSLHFIRTTDPHHKGAAKEMWRRCSTAGDIYKKKYKGLYCVGDEAFLKESDLVNGKCPNHPSMDPVEIEEENYFFKLSAYQEKLLKYLGKEGVITPEWRRLEAFRFVENGLEDFSISRVKEKMPWGIPVPDDDSQIMYVWFDALTNYISTLGWPEDEANFKKYWGTVNVPNAVQMAGKDQVRFQSIMWQAMLMSAGLPTTKQVMYHGFITSGGQKMSKSIGNVVSPYELVEKYGTDATRYLLLRHAHPFEDSDITWEKLDEWYTADLVNGLGNLVARIMQLAETYLPGPITKPNIEGEFPHGYYLDRFEINKYVGQVWDEIQSLDSVITKTEPFKIVKQNLGDGEALIRGHVEGLYLTAHSLGPVMPNTSEIIQKAILENKKPKNLFPRK